MALAADLQQSSDFTVAPGQAGFYAIHESSLQIPADTTAPASFEVLVLGSDPEQATRTVVSTQLKGGDTFEFDNFLGYLNDGDRVQVRIDGQPAASSAVDYTVVQAPLFEISALPQDAGKADTPLHGGQWALKSGPWAGDPAIQLDGGKVCVSLVEGAKGGSVLAFRAAHTGYYALHDAWIQQTAADGDAVVEAKLFTDQSKEPLRTFTIPAGDKRVSLNTEIGYLQKDGVIGITLSSEGGPATANLAVTIAEWAPRQPPLRVQRGADGYLNVYEPENQRQAVDIPSERWVEVPAQDGDATEAIRQALAQAQILQQGDDYAGVRLAPEATYTVASDQAGGRLFVIKNAQRLIFDGNGASLQMNSPELQRQDIDLFRTEHCQRIAFADLTVLDQAQPYSVGEVVQVKDIGRGNQDVYFKVPPGQPHPIEDIARNGKTGGYAYDPDIPGRLAEGTWSHYPEARKYPEGPRIKPAGEPGLFTHAVTRTNNSIEVGQKWAVKNKGAGVVYLVALASDNITLSGIDGKAHGGGAVRNWDASVNVLDCRFEPQGDHWLSATSDGIHGRGREGVWVEDTTLRGICEDIMNTYGHSMLVVADDIPDDNVVSIRMGQRARDGSFSPANPPDNIALRVGDTVQFFNPNTGLVLGQAVVRKIDDGRYTLSQPITGIKNWEPGDDKRATIVYNTALAARAYVRDSAFMDSMRFGIFIKAPHSVVFNSHFEGLPAPAIFVANEPDWPEGPPTTHLWLQGNHFKQNNYDYQSQNRAFLVVDPADISIYTRRLRGDSEPNDMSSNISRGQFANSHMKIIGNEFEDWRGMGISVRNARNVLIADNVFHSPVDDSKMRATLAKDEALNDDGHGCYAAIFLDSVNGARIGGNRFFGFSEWDKPIVFDQDVENVSEEGNISAPSSETDLAAKE